MDAPDEDAGAAEDDKFAAVLERRRAHTAAKRAAEKACLEARRDRKRAKREGASDVDCPSTSDKPLQSGPLAAGGRCLNRSRRC